MPSNRKRHDLLTVAILNLSSPLPLGEGLGVGFFARRNSEKKDVKYYKTNPIFFVFKRILRVWMSDSRLFCVVRLLRFRFVLVFHLRKLGSDIGDGVNKCLPAAFGGR